MKKLSTFTLTSPQSDLIYMVKINKIYTRSGDDGTTGLVGGERTAKNSPKVSAYGDVDETNSHLGMVRTLAEQAGLKELSAKIETIQNELFDIGSALATPQGYDKYPVFKVSEDLIKRLETWIDQAVTGLPELKSFVLPGGTPINAALHLARAVSRRAERSILTLSTLEQIDPKTLVYINRLSDLLFAWSRAESKRAGAPEYLWTPAGKRS